MIDEYHGLTDTDLDNLTKSYITPELAFEADLYRVSDSEGLRLLGKKPDGRNHAGIVIPYRLPGDSGIRHVRLRRDKPDRQWKDGHWKEEAKYLSPARSRNRIYFPPGIPVVSLTDPSTQIVVVEGEKKALALWRYVKDRELRWLPIGVAGVWSWRGQIGREPGPNVGEWIAVKGMIPDFELLSWRGRDVTILFDANVRTNPSVRAARANLRRELMGRGAKVEYAEVPETTAVNGIDDLLGLYGPEAADDVFRERPSDNGSGDENRAAFWKRIKAERATRDADAA